MHELSLVDELVTECRSLAKGRTVLEVRARCTLGVEAGEVSECFAFLARQLVDVSGDRCLAGAELKLITVPLVLNCGCGFDGQLDADHLAGHISVCPRCGRTSEAKTGLDLVGMSFADNKPCTSA